jgi:hypothetical protein
MARLSPGRKDAAPLGPCPDTAQQRQKSGAAVAITTAGPDKLSDMLDADSV